MVMSRVSNRQFGASGTDYYGAAAGGGVGATFNASVGGSADARWSGIVVVVLLAAVWIGYHGLKG